MDALPGLGMPDLQQAKRILAIQPHYDDNDIAAGGTLYALAQAGAELIYLTVMDDLKGVRDPAWTPGAARRRLQANREKAGALLGVSGQILLGFPDATALDHDALRDRLIEAIHRTRPDFIVTVDPWTPYEAHQDHIATGKAAAEAALLYGLPAFGGGQPLGFELQGVAFYNSAYPNHIRDISAVLEMKNEILRCYEAQFTPGALEELVAQTTLLSAYMAREKDFPYAEAFKVVAPWMLHGVPLTMQL